MNLCKSFGLLLSCPLEVGLLSTLYPNVDQNWPVRISDAGKQDILKARNVMVAFLALAVLKQLTLGIDITKPLYEHSWVDGAIVGGIISPLFYSFVKLGDSADELVKHRINQFLSDLSMALGAQPPVQQLNVAIPPPNVALPQVAIPQMALSQSVDEDTPDQKSSFKK